jgi:uncharacterized protein YqjF (DUF2071 family)
MSWTIEQRWSQVLFVNWKVPVTELQYLVPFPLDLYQGRAVLSLVPFFMDRVRFRGLPGIPFGSSLWEINLRTYVIVNGIPGIYFFTLETPHRVANAIARTFFNLPYRDARVHATVSEAGYRLSVTGDDARGIPYHLNLEGKKDLGGLSSEPNAKFQTWVTERYHLFVKKDGSTIRGDVFHPPWSVQKACITNLEGGISILPSLPRVDSLEECFWAEPLRVRFAPFTVQAGSG